MKVYTAQNGAIADGAKIEKFLITSAGVEINAILIGEEGRGRERGVLPVQGGAPDDFLRFALVSQTKAGKPKLVACGMGDGSACIVVFRTKGGYRGGASHTGDRNGLYMVDSYSCPLQGVTLEEARSHAAANGVHPDNIHPDGFLPFPGGIICRGKIAEGDAGRMGGNEQIVAVMPAGVWFRTGYSGRLYGAPAAHYYHFNGNRLIAATWEERQLMEESN